MIDKIKSTIKKNTEIFALSLLIIITVISTTFYNQSKKKIIDNYKNTINNIYLKKTLNHIFNNLEPKYKVINHKIVSGETFQSILRQYQVKEEEINQIKGMISKKINLNNLNTNNKISFIFDQANSLVKEFTFQISNKEKLYLKRNLENNEFSEKILVTKLKKEILYKENIILQSLYRAASQEKIPANIIIDFASKYISKFLTYEFFIAKYHKSLDREYFIKYLNYLKEQNLTDHDLMATLLEFTVISIQRGILQLPKKPKLMVVTGGGYLNSYLLKKLKQRLKIKFINSKNFNFSTDFVESELIAYLSARSINNLPITFPKTTGVNKPLCGGTTFFPEN